MRQNEKNNFCGGGGERDKPILQYYIRENAAPNFVSPPLSAFDPSVKCNGLIN